MELEVLEEKMIKNQICVNLFLRKKEMMMKTMTTIRMNSKLNYQKIKIT